MLALAREDARRIRTEAQTEAEERVTEADQHLAQLEHQRAALSSYVEDMRSLLAGGDSGLTLSSIVGAAEADASAQPVQSATDSGKDDPSQPEQAE